jgi:hypothetical protein
MFKIKCLSGKRVTDVSKLSRKELRQYTFKITVDVDGHGIDGTAPYEKARALVKSYGQKDSPDQYRAAIAEFLGIEFATKKGLMARLKDVVTPTPEPPKMSLVDQIVDVAVADVKAQLGHIDDVEGIPYPAPGMEPDESPTSSNEPEVEMAAPEDTRPQIQQLRDDPRFCELHDEFQTPLSTSSSREGRVQQHHARKLARRALKAEFGYPAWG